MTTDTRCEVTELLVDECAHCRYLHEHRLPATVDGKWTVFRARYAGTCADCGEWFPPDVEIARLPDGGGYVCQGCWEVSDA